ncbi:secretion protein [Methylocaldum marinum]|uniref:Secretion protein n=1 Tax=Methylocaldum marinum TaxID=1432792 RepID=A0A250L3K3_9GAMM|nr:HlyD family efflux transporter periplasmic adaptor subunit [Methylocaldum marinum]BBA37409.1 secretion protein [Methylocaldum marinum]
MPEPQYSERQLLRMLGDPQLAVTHPAAHPILWVSLLCIAAFITWASLAELDEVTRGEGRVVPFSRLQKIQSLEGGILEELLVREGDIVEVGQPLLRLDSTRFQSSYMESLSQAEALRAAIARLETEVLNRSEIAFPGEVDPNSPVARSERALLKARRDKLREALASLKHELELARKQEAIVRPLVGKRAVSEVEAIKLSKEIASLTGKIAEISNSYTQDAYTELTTKKAELTALEQILVQRKDQLRRTEIVSPVKGRVNKLMITTRGGVIQPGEPIMEVTPIMDQLLVEAKVKPRDVAFLAHGMPARVKITAYDYTIYGELSAKLKQISEDTIEEDTPRGKESYYQIQVLTDLAFLRYGDEILPIRPGMVAEVDVLTGKRTVLNYLLRPLLKARLY